MDSVTDANYDPLSTSDDDPRAMLAKIMSPAPAAQLVGPPPDIAPKSAPGQSTPRTGNLAMAPQQAVPKNRDTGTGYNTGVSNPPNGGNVNSIASPAQEGQTPASRFSQLMTRPQAPAMPNAVQGTLNSMMPSLPQAAQPSVQGDPLNMQTQRDQSRLAMLKQTGSGVSQIQNPFLRGLARVGDVAGSILAPGVTAQIPGTTLHNQQLVGRQQALVGNDQAQSQAQAQLADTQQKTALDAAKAAGTALVPVTPEMAEVNPALKGLVGQSVSQQTLGGVAKAATTGTLRNQGQIDKQDDPDSFQAKNAQSLAEVRQTQQQLNQAKAELAKAGNDPRSPAYQLAFKKAQTAQQNANAATTRATAYYGNYLQGAYNKGLGGDTLPGAPQIGNDQGNRTVVGTKNAGTAIKNQANVAQFNDVHGALDSLEGSARALVQSGGKLNSPRVAAALAQPHGTLTQWIQGEGVKQGMTPQERDYVIANAAAHENIQAMRKAAGGTATDSSVAKLDALIPGASTPDLNYFLKQTGQIRSTAQRLGSGVTTAAGGSNLQHPAPPPAKPGGSLPGHEVWVRGADGKLVKQ